MSLSDITEKIIKEAEEKAEQTRKETATQVSSIEEETKKMIAEKQQSYSESIKKTLTDNKKKVTAATEHKTKLSLESMRRAKLDSVFNNALKKLELLDDNEYGKILASLLENLPKNISGKAMCPAKRIPVTKKVFQECGINIDITEDNTISGGVIISENNTQYDLTFKRKMGEVKKSLEIEVASILFS